MTLVESNFFSKSRFLQMQTTNEAAKPPI